MDGVGARSARGVDDARNVEVALARPARARCGTAASASRDVRRARRRRPSRRRRSRCPSRGTSRMTRQRDLAAVGDEHAANHESCGLRRRRSRTAGRFSRNARMPSWPSGDTRWFAIVIDRRGPARRRAPAVHVGEQRLGARDADGAALRNSCDVLVHGGVEPLGRDDLVDEADLLRARRREARARQAQLARGRQADLAHARTARSSPAECRASTSVKPNTRVVRRDDDVADGREAGAAAERRAVDARR